jgi:hypothetical protein
LDARPLKVIATVGLVLGGVFGIAGTMVPPPLQAILWAIDGAGLMMATALLTIKYLRAGNDVVAGGFLVFAIGEGVLLSSAAADPESSIPSFAAGVTLWGTRAASGQRSKAVRFAGSHRRHRERHPVYPHGRKNLYGRATTADFNTAASRRLSIFGRNIHRLDLDAMAIRETGLSQAILHYRLRTNLRRDACAMPWHHGLQQAG